MSDEQKNDEVRISPPEYIRLVDNEREAFLSQIGNFTPPQRQLFHALCTSWRPEIHYRQFAESRSMSVKNVYAELDNLMEKLRKNRYGLVTLQLENGELHKRSVILCMQGEPRFYRYNVQNEYIRIEKEQSHLLVNNAYLKELDMGIPDAATFTLERGQLTKEFIEEQSSAAYLAKVPVTGGEFVYFPSDRLNSLINLCIQTIRHHFQNNNLLSEIARFKKTTLTTLKQNLATKAPLFWIDITKGLLEYNSSVHAGKKISISAVMCQAADVLHNFLENQIAESKRQKEEAKERDADMRTFVEQLKDRYIEPISQDQFNQDLDRMKLKYGDSFEQFKSDFYDSYVTVKDATKIPPILFIGKSYIHRDHLYKHALVEFHEVSQNLEKEYTRLMSMIIRTNNKSENSTFYSRDNLNKDIEERVKHIDPFLHDLLQKPRLFAETIIYVAKQDMKAKNIDSMKIILEKFFKPGTMVYRELSAVFAVNVYAIFEKAFGELGFFRQLIARITGKYESYKEKFIGYRPKVPVNPKGGASKIAGGQESLGGRLSDSSFRRDESGGGASGGRGGSGGTRGKSGGGARGRSTGGGTVAPPPKPSYSKDQQNKAWQDFSKTLKK